MVSPSALGGFAPIERAAIAVAGDGACVAITEASRITLLELPSGRPFAEVGIDPLAIVTDVGWVGMPPRLLVLSQYAEHSQLYLIDPQGPRTVAEIQIASPTRLRATVGPHALAVGPRTVAVVTSTDRHLTPHQFPSRAVPTAVGAAAGMFMVAVPAGIEEWDPNSRTPRRRLRLPRPAAITAVGGTERLVWMTTQQEPARIEVIALVNRSQPKVHELPEPIASVSSHPRSDVVVCLGADTGRAYVIDLDGRARTQVVAPEGVDRVSAAGLVIGRMFGLVAIQAGRPIAIVPLGSQPSDAPPAASAAARPHEPAAPSDEPPEVGSRPSTLFDDPAPPSEPPEASLAARVAGVRDRMQAPRPDLIPEPRPEPRPDPRPDPRPEPRPEPRPDPELRPEPASRALLTSRGEPSTWRDAVVGWARTSIASATPRALPPVAEIEVLAERFDLSAELVPALALLYGAHLAGERGAAPVDVARVLGRQWDEALGRGQLAARGIAVYAESRVRLAAPVQRVLDELPVTTGTLIGEPGAIALLGPCVVVASDASLAAVAERCLARVGGAILVSHDGRPDGELFLEARARGVAPMVRVSPGEVASIGAEAAILVVTDEAFADQLGIPRLA